jgi:hypothetical protein
MRSSSMITAEVTAQSPVLMLNVRVGGEGSETRHEVTLSHRDLARLGRPGETAESFVTRCFTFLLAREPKESILKRFDVSVISDYFAEFEEEIRRPA